MPATPFWDSPSCCFPDSGNFVLEKLSSWHSRLSHYSLFLFKILVTILSLGFLCFASTLTISILFLFILQMKSSKGLCEFPKIRQLKSDKVRTGTSSVYYTNVILLVMIREFVLVQKHEDPNDSKVLIFK